MRLIATRVDRPAGQVLLVQCPCGVVIRQPAAQHRIDCPVCGRRGDTRVVLEGYALACGASRREMAA